MSETHDMILDAIPAYSCFAHLLTLGVIRSGGKDTVCPTGGGVGQPLSTGIPARGPPAPLPTTTHLTLTCGISNSDCMQIQARHRECVCAREEKRGGDRSAVAFLERELPGPSSSFLLLPLSSLLVSQPAAAERDF